MTVQHEKLRSKANFGHSLRRKHKISVAVGKLVEFANTLCGQLSCLGGLIVAVALHLTSKGNSKAADVKATFSSHIRLRWKRWLLMPLQGNFDAQRTSASS